MTIDLSLVLWLIGLLLAVIGASVLLGINLLLRALRSQSDAQQLQATLIAEIRITLLGADGTGGLLARVNSLHDWRNDLQRQELDRVRLENDRLKDRLQEGT